GHAVDGPAAGRAAKGDAFLPGTDLDLHNVRRFARDQALAGKVNHLLQLGPMTADRDQSEQYDEKRRGERRHKPHGAAALARLRIHRRLHHTKTPHSIVDSGSSTSSAMNTSRIWRLVRMISGS